MRVSTVREFRDNATTFFRSSAPVLVTRRGRVAGIFFPAPDGALPIEFRRELFTALSDQVRREIAQKGIAEDEILADFADWRKKKRETRRRR
jgi:hypothetical protein